jgi:dihydrofolate reductase
MKHFKAIVAMSLNRVIGAGGKIPWHLPEDFKWFKQMTTGHVIVMGRKTFESIGKPLPNRTTIVLSRSRFQHPGVRVIHDLGELIQSAGCPPPRPSPHPMGGGWPSGRERGDLEAIPSARQIFICGGAQVYVQALPLCSDLYLTLVKRTVEGDVFFPKFEDQFELAEEVFDCPDFKILHYRRRVLGSLES